MVTWSENPQSAIPPAGESDRDRLCGVQQLGELLPAVLARHGLSETAEESQPPVSRPVVAVPAVLPQSECPAAT